MTRSQSIKRVAYLGIALSIVGVLITPRSETAFTIRLIEQDQYNGQAVWEIRNESASVVTYRGTGIFWLGFSPAWGSVEIVGPESKYSHGGWCGNGLGTRVLLPYSSKRFVAFPPQRDRRVALRIKSGLLLRNTVEVIGPTIEEIGT